ncbi:MAG TPA: hypothetical protein DEB46_05370 [Myxococcales bacterium]|nr:hypothetical protein [Myxococcales bacterium]
MIRFAWREMVTAFRRRPWLMLCWLAVLSSCLMAMGWIQGFAEGARRAAAQIEPEHQIWAFARPDAEAKPLEDLLRRIGSLPSVERVRRLNAAEVRRRIAVELSSETSASDLPDGLLPQSIQITPIKSGVNPAVLEILRASEAIEWVDAGDIQVNQARARVRSLDRSAQALSLLLLVTLLLLGLGLGRLAMSLRRDEVAVMRLVGGSHLWIGAPMMLSAVIIGLSAALIAFVGCRVSMAGLTELTGGGMYLVAPVPAYAQLLRLVTVGLLSQTLGVLLGVMAELNRSEMDAL